MKYAYFPGCSAESTARDQYSSTMAVAGALGIGLVEPAGWTCCGSTPAHQVNSELAVALAAANLVKAQEMGLDLVVSCASCYNRLKTANHEIRNSPRIRNEVADALGKEYDGSVRVRHFVEVVLEDLKTEALKARLVRSLNGLRVASYYGCLLVRPNEVTGFDDPENPVYLDRLVDALGGESVDWPCKVDCCGAGLTLTRPGMAVSFADAIVGMARESGADCIAVACPMCQINLDMRQSDSRMPILYITQLMGMCLGATNRELGISRLIQSPQEIMTRVK